MSISDIKQTHNLFHWVKQKDNNSISVDKAKGIYFWDRTGKRYFDFSSQLVNVNIGHGNEKVISAVTEQMKKITYANPANIAIEARDILAKRLHNIYCPSKVKKTFFTLCGSGSNELAINLAKLFTGKNKIITHQYSYHGAATGAAALGGDPISVKLENIFCNYPIVTFFF